MKKLKAITVVGTRPEIIRLSRVIFELDNSEAIDHVLIHTGQNYDYELNEIFFNDLGIREPDFFLNAAGGNAVSTIGNILVALDPLLDEINPEAMLVLGDTNSSLCAIAAKKKKIPIFHMEAGNRCFDQRVPEETNRIIVDHISDINLTYSDIAREYLLREGISSDRIIKTGSPIYEVPNYYSDGINNSKILSKMKLHKGKYFVLSAHREENISNERNFLSLVKTLNILSDKFKLPIIFSTHPRTRKQFNEIDVEINQLVRFSKPVGFLDYNALQKSAKAVLSDSGTISEESSILNFPALNIREAHERPEAMEEASVIMTGMDSNRILQGLSELEKNEQSTKRVFREVADYTMPNVSKKIVRIIISYVNYINQNTWKI